MLGGATVCSGHRFLCVAVPHSTRPRLTFPTRSPPPVPVQLGSVSISLSNWFSSKLSFIPRAADTSTAHDCVVFDDDGFSVSKKEIVEQLVEGGLGLNQLAPSTFVGIAHTFIIKQLF